METRLHSIFGWLRRLGGFGTAPNRVKNRSDRSASRFEALERREVLSTATFAPFAAPVVGPAVAPIITVPVPAASTSVGLPTSFGMANPSPTPASIAGQPVMASSTIAPVYYSGQPVVSPTATGISAVNVETDYVQALYRTVLNRVGSPHEVAAWVAKMSAGVTIPEVAASFVNSTEHREAEVDSYYQEFLHRTPDSMASFWVSALQNGASEESVVDGIIDMPEYQATHPDSASLIQGLYQDVLGRQADPAGYAEWSAALSAGATRAMLVDSFVHSAEAVDQVIENDYMDYLHRQPDLATSSQWASVLASPTGSASQLAVALLSSAEFVQDSEQV